MGVWVLSGIKEVLQGVRGGGAGVTGLGLSWGMVPLRLQGTTVREHPSREKSHFIFSGGKAKSNGKKEPERIPLEKMCSGLSCGAGRAVQKADRDPLPVSQPGVHASCLDPCLWLQLLLTLSRRLS